MASSSSVPNLYEELAKQILPHLIKELEKKGRKESKESLPATSSPLHTIKHTEMQLEENGQDTDLDEELDVDSFIKDKFGRRPRPASTLSVPPPNLEEQKEMLENAGSVSLHQLMSRNHPSSSSSSLDPMKLQDSLNRYRNQSTSQSTGPGRTTSRIKKNTKSAVAQVEETCAKKPPELNKHVKVYFLGDKDEKNVPTLDRSLKLHSQIPKLGEDVVGLSKKGDSIHFEAMVKGKGICKGHDPSIVWKPLHVIGAGKYQPLQEFDFNSYPSVPSYTAMKKNTLYLQPSVTIVALANDDKKKGGKNVAPGNFLEDDSDGGSDEETTSKDPLENIFTLEQFRFEVCEQLPKREVEVNRMNTAGGQQYLNLEEELNRYSPKYNILQIPIVNFVGEVGYDAGGVTREYFFQLLLACVHSSYKGVPLFEGKKSSLVPSRDTGLLNDGVYQKLTRMLLDSTLHYGVFMIGLSKTIQEYLTCDDPERVIMWEIETEEIPDADAQEAAKTLERFNNNSLLVTDEELSAAEKTLINFNFGSKITGENSANALYCLKFETVIGCRLRTLQVMREVLLDSPITKILNKSQYLKHDVFPHPEDYKTTVEQLLLQFSHQEENPVRDMIKKVGLYCRKRGGDTPSKLLQFLTGSPVLDNNIFTIKIIPRNFEEQTTDPKTGMEKTETKTSWVYANVCSRELLIPAEITQAELEIQLDRCLENNLGFGRF